MYITTIICIMFITSFTLYMYIFKSACDSMVNGLLLKPMVFKLGPLYFCRLLAAWSRLPCRFGMCFGLPFQEACPEVPVRGNYDGKFAAALPTQGLPAAMMADAAEDEVEAEAEADDSRLLLAEPQAQGFLHLF